MPPLVRPPSLRLHDSHYANVQMLLHGDGTNGGSLFPDNSQNSASASRVGSPTTETGTVKVGTAAMSFGGGADAISYPNLAAYALGAGDFTIECWIYPLSIATERQILGIYATTGSSSRAWLLEMGAGGGIGGLISDGSDHETFSVGAVSANVWTHVAYCRDSGTVRIYLNGVQDTSASSSIVGQAGTDLIYIGAFNNGSVASPSLIRFWDGYIDEVRVTIGYSRYPGGTTFTPSTIPFPNF